MAVSQREMIIDLHLFKELTEKYPEVPEDVVSDHLRMTGNDKDECVKLLKSQSPQYLYGNQDVPCGIVMNQVKNLSISNRNQQFHSLPRPQSSGTKEAPSTPPTSYASPVLPTDFDSFVEAADNKQGSIPNINCTMHKSESSPSVSQTVRKFEVNSIAHSKTSPVIGKRPVAVTVIHCASTSSDSGQIVAKSSSYQIHTTGVNSGGTCTVVDPSQQKSSHTTYNISQQDSQRSIINASPNQYAHSAQARLLINQPNNGHHNIDRSIINPRTNQYTTGSDQQNLFVQPNRTVSMNPLPSNMNTNYSKPLYVKIRSSGPEGSETQVHYNHSPSFGSPTQPLSSNRQNSYHSGQRVQIAPYSKVSPNSYVQFPQYPSSANVQYPSNSSVFYPVSVPYPASAGVQYSSSVGLQYPACTGVQYPASAGINNAHITSSSRTSSVDSESGNVFLAPEGDINPPVVYPMSPASSHSSLSSEASAHLPNTRPTSGNMHEDQDYVRALLHHQHLRLDNLKKDYNDTHTETEKLMHLVAQMEKNMQESTRRNSFPTIEDVTKLRETNRRLQTDIQCMGNEVDMKKNGQGGFSLVDPADHQNFYNHIPTGPSGPIGRPANPPPLPPPLNLHPRSPILDVVPPVPPRQPSAGSGDSEEGEQWNCSACTLLNHPALNKCECCEMPRISIGMPRPHHHNGHELCYCHDH